MTDAYLTPIEQEIHDLLRTGKNLADIVHVTALGIVIIAACP